MVSGQVARDGHSHESFARFIKGHWEAVGMARADPGSATPVRSRHMKSICGMNPWQMEGEE